MLDQLIEWQIIGMENYPDVSISEYWKTTEERNYWLAIVNAPLSKYNLTREERLNVLSHAFKRLIPSTYAVTLREAMTLCLVTNALQGDQVIKDFVEEYKYAPFR